MLTEAETDAIASKLLSKVLQDLSEHLPPNLFQPYRLENGEPVAIYSDASVIGHGAFACQYMPYKAAKKIVAQCDQMYAELLTTMDKKSRSNLEEHYAVGIESMADMAILHLIASFSDRLRDTIDDAVEDSYVIGATLAIASVIKHIRTADNRPVKGDIKTHIDKAVRRAADKRRLLLTQHINAFPNMMVGRGRGGARNVKHIWNDQDRACLANKYTELQPIWIEAKRIARVAQNSAEITRKKDWRNEVSGVYPNLPKDLLEKFATLKGDDSKPSDIALAHAARLCLPPNVQLSIPRLRAELRTWKNKEKS